MPDQTASYLNLVMSLLLSKVIVPTDFKSQAILVNGMLNSDTSGLVDSLTNFQVDCATVEVGIDTESPSLDDTFKNWLNNINSEYRGRGVETGIRGLMREYYKERWRGASFPILKILRWEKIDGMNLPVSMTFVNGGSIYAKDKNNSKDIGLIGYDYFLGRDTEEKIEGQAYLMYKLFVRWFDKYPTPYLIRRGVYKNWKVIDMIKNKEIELVDQIIPYLLLITKGNEQLEIQKDVTYTDEELQGVKKSVQELVNKLNTVNFTDDNRLAQKTPIRARNWDEDIKHLIPDLKSMFDNQLFINAEKAILGGLGFMDIAETVSSSRKESVLNPKPFIKECNAGLNDFINCVLKDLLDLIKEKNPEHIKHNANTWIIEYRPITDFITEDFKTMIRSLSDRGLISNDTAEFVCSSGNINYELEKRKRIEETKEGDDYIMYPKITINTEKDITSEESSHQLKYPQQANNQSLENQGKKKGSPESKNFINAMLEESEEDTILELAKLIDSGLIELIGSPYNKVADLPPAVHKHLDLEGQRKWMAIWNGAYKFYLKKLGDAKKAETLAFKTAWSQSKKGNIFQRATQIFKSTPKTKLEKSTLEKSKETSTEELIELEIKTKKLNLLDKLLGRKNENI